MSCKWPSLAVVFGLMAVTSAQEPNKLPPPTHRKIDFATDVQPLLQKNCYSCHGPEHQEGGLRLDDKKRALEGGDSGVEIVVGKSAESRLIRVMAGVDDDFGRMPPEVKGTPLSSEEVALVRAWIDQGAKWPDATDVAGAAVDHWSLKPIRRHQQPQVQYSRWLREPIDAFILARLEREQIRPSPSAERTTLLRRLHLDLLGLPPTPEQVNEFQVEERPDADLRLIDRLLASPAFGERWGRHWLDLARYADSDGYEKDRPRPFAYKYRDWVIAAINADMPYDQFTIEQIAGDMLPEATLAQQIAAGMHRNTLHNTEGGIDPEEDRVKKTVDRTNTLGAIWLALTVGCAQCHSHKYDPITQREYYSLYAFFNSMDEKDLETLTPEQAAALSEARKNHSQRLEKLEAAVAEYVDGKLPEAQTAWEKSLAGLSKEELFKKNVPAAVAAALLRAPEQRPPSDIKWIAEHYRAIDKELAKLEKSARDHKAKAPQPPLDAKAQSVVQRVEPRETRIHIRGDFLSPGDPVQSGTPSILPAPQPASGTHELFTASGGREPPDASPTKLDRLDLAYWLVDPANPLPARVAANRIWHRLFGRGIVPTLDDFGKQGEQPSHPELLDWLASEFIGCETLARRASEGNPLSNAWSVKRLIRRVVSSGAYQQSSAPRRDIVDRDPENVLVARQSRRRVEAEVIRDLTMASSGLLSTHIGGPSVRPPQPAEYATLTYANSAKWVESKGADRYRRGMYTFFQRTSPYPMLMTFDSPDSNECTASRQTSNTPLQALTLWNDPVFFQCAQALGRRIVAEVPPQQGVEETIRLRGERAFALCLARKPSPAEAAEIVSLYEAARQIASQDEAAARQMIGEPLPPPSEVPELAPWITVARALLNLDEFVTRE